MGLVTDPAGVVPSLMNIQFQDVEIESGDLATTFYTSAGGAWTVSVGDIDRYVYAVAGHLAVVMIDLSDTQTGAAMSTGLNIVLPDELAANFGSSSGIAGVCSFNEGGTNFGTGTVYIGASELTLRNRTWTAWPSSVSNLQIFCQAIFRLDQFA